MMLRREILGSMGAGAAGLVAMQGLVHAQDHEHHPALADHIQLLDDCARICSETAAHCLEKAQESGSNGGQKNHLKAHTAAIDCQEFCRLTSELMARGSDMATYAHEACAKACASCAQTCRSGDDDVMKACARKCEECEKMCRSMSSQRRA